MQGIEGCINQEFTKCDTPQITKTLVKRTEYRNKSQQQLKQHFIDIKGSLFAGTPEQYIIFNWVKGSDLIPAKARKLPFSLGLAPSN